MDDKTFYANTVRHQQNVYLHLTDKLYQTLPLYSNLATTGVYIYAQDFRYQAPERADYRGVTSEE
jgi:beta-galactosidase